MTVLAFKNEELSTFIPTRDLSAITRGLIDGTTPIPDADIVGLNNESVFYYAANNLVVTLDDGLPNEWFFAGPEVRVNGFWKMTDTSPDGTEFSKYQRFETDADVNLFTPGRIVISINSSDEQQVRDAYTARSLQKPDFGILVVVLSFVPAGSSERRERAYCIKYSHLPLFSSAPIFFPFTPTVTAENTYKSPPYSFETFFIPTISSSFHYNFFEEEEDNYSIYNSRDYSGLPLSDVPKYVKLTWNAPVFNYSEWLNENSLPTFVFFTSSATGAPATAPEGVSIRSFAATSATPSSSRSEPTDTSGLGIVMSSPSSRTGGDAIRAFDGEIGGGFSPEELGTLPPGVTDPSVTERIVPTVTIGLDSDYIGYIIEKEKIEEDGTVTVLDLIAVAGKNTLKYIDYKIAYGEIYRYKVRSVFRYVSPTNNFSLFQDSDTSITQEQATQYIDLFASNVLNRTYYYDGVYSNVSEIQTTEAVRPDHPENLQLFAKSRDKKILLTWNQKNQAKDVIGFNVYRKQKNEFYQRLNNELLDLRTNIYVDFDIEPEIEYIYAVEAVDFHGNFSKLSTQLSISTREITTNEFVCDNKQVFYEYPGKEISDLPVKPKRNLLVCKSELALNINPLFTSVNFEDDFMIKLTSLDTGLVKEIDVKFESITIYHASPLIPAEETDSLFFNFGGEDAVQTITRIFSR